MPKARKSFVSRAGRREEQRERERLRKAARAQSHGFFGFFRRLFRRK